MIINLLVLILAFYIIGRLLKSKFKPSERFSARWGKAYVVALFAIPTYFVVVLTKEYVLYITTYQTMIDSEQIGAGQVFVAMFTGALWPAVYGVIFGPLIMAMTSWNRQAKVETQET